MSDNRTPRPFDPQYLRILGLNFEHYSRSIVMEVLRGIGCLNERMMFRSMPDMFEFGSSLGYFDFAILSHEADTELDLDMIEKWRRGDDIELSATPIILVTSAATPSMIRNARDAGVDEVLSRPLSPRQLLEKVRQLVESPRPFVTATHYVGPCRRRKTSENYSGPRRRIDDYAEDHSRIISNDPGADELAMAVSELRSACGELTDERLGLVARVRKTAQRTAELAKKTGDIPLERTAAAVKLYLDGMGSQNTMETHVLETGINALTQLAVLPNSYHGARQSVASLMTIAVRKKLLLYDKRAQAEDGEPNAALKTINSGVKLTEPTTVYVDDDTDKKKLKA